MNLAIQDLIKRTDAPSFLQLLRLLCYLDSFVHIVDINQEMKPTHLNTGISIYMYDDHFCMFAMFL